MHQLLIEEAVTIPRAVFGVLEAFKVNFIKLMVFSELLGLSPTLLLDVG